MEQIHFKVGDIAKRTGITIRALHHYEALGVVKPSMRSRAGYRLYDARDIARLQIVRSLQELGFSLKQVKEMMSRPEITFSSTIGQHLSLLKEKIRREKILCDRLRSLEEILAERESVPVEEILRLLKMMDEIEKFNLDPKDEEKLRKHWGSLTQDDIKAVETEWPKLIAEVREEMNKGTDPKDPTVQKLAKRWMELVNSFTAGIPKMAERVSKNLKENAVELKKQHGEAMPTAEMFNYIQHALK